MPDSIDDDRSEQMEDRLDELTEHIGEAEGRRDDVAPHAEAAGEERGSSTSSEDTDDDAGSGSEPAAPGPGEANGEVEEEQANPT